MRIQFKPGLQLLSRGPATVQIGLDGRHGAVLDGLTADDIDVLHALADGVDATLVTGPLPADEGQADTAARARRLVTLLAGSNTLVHARSGRAALARVGELRARLSPDAAAWSLTHPGAGDGWELLAARRRRRVLIQGSGRTGPLLAATLAATGVGDVVVQDTEPVAATDLAPGGAVPGDLGLSRADAARRAVGRALGHDPGPTPGNVSGNVSGPTPGNVSGPPDLVVLVDRSAADAARTDQLLAGDIAHLSIVVRETAVVVGPLVLPGRSPCLRCLDLHRAEQDEQWPLVLAQLLGDRLRRRGPREETALAQSAAALAALQVLGQLDGQRTPAAVGATLEVELPDGLAARRQWPSHPACGCHRLPG